MFVISNFIVGVADILNILLNVFLWAIIIRALISWVNPDPYNVIIQILHKVTEPVLYPLRHIMPTHSIGIDLSPFIACLAIIFIRSFLVRSLYQIAQALQ